MASTKAENIDEYIARFPAKTQQALQLIRATIKKLAPEASEAISYGIPAFNLNKRYLIYFAGFKNHIGMYPAPVEEESFKDAITPYKSGKATVQFPLNAPMPVDLIEKIVVFKIAQNRQKATKAKR
jgi:uncharacterized protein YdhG (YjbR/CyaY superfamily)